MTTAFDQASYRAATAFLQTVLLVDNRARFETGDTPPTDLVEPDDLASAPEEFLPHAVALNARDVDELDAGAISGAFAGRGLVCGILKPTEADRQRDAVLAAARNADVVVLDWQMDDSGGLATDIIQSLVEQDATSGGRLRLVAVYTGFSPLKDISKSLRKAYPTLRKTNGLSLDAGHARVVFLAKDTAHNATDENKEAVTEEGLPERLITEFARFAGGLLPNATLATMAGVRQHTHRMLARFDGSMDGPFLSHRALLPSPAEAEEYAADLIMAELQSQVPVQRIVSEYLGERSIKDYVEHQVGKGAKPALMLDVAGKIVHELQSAQVVGLIELGVSALSAEMPAMKQKAPLPANVTESYERWLDVTMFDRLYLLFAKTVKAGKDDHARFAVRAKLRRDASALQADAPDKMPMLSLGSIVASGNRYWVCLTPLCDSTRLQASDNRLLLAELETDNRHFDLVVQDGTVFKRLKVVRKRTNLASYRFAFDAAGEVRAKLVDGTALFESLDDAPSGPGVVGFRWLGELKRMHAQRLVQAFTSNLARVGLDDFEWHRQQMPKV